LRKFFKRKKKDEKFGRLKEKYAEKAYGMWYRNKHVNYLRLILSMIT